MAKQKILRLEDTVYVINSFKGIKGLRLLQRVTKQLLPLWNAYISGVYEVGSDAKLINELQDLLLADEKGEFAQLLLDLVDEVEVDGIRIDPDKEFECAYDRIFFIAFEVLKLNYFETFQKLVTNLIGSSESETENDQ